MAICAFFGHRECPVSIEKTLLRTLEDSILDHGTNQFNAGNLEQFDAYVHKVLKIQEARYPYIPYAVMLPIRSSIFHILSKKRKIQYPG